MDKYIAEDLKAAVLRLTCNCQKSSSDYEKIVDFINKAIELIDIAAKCMDDCDYAMTKVSNDRVEDAISIWNGAYNRFKSEYKKEEKINEI